MPMMRWRIRLRTWSTVIERWEQTPARLLPRQEITALVAQIVAPLTKEFSGSGEEWRAREKLETRCEALLSKPPV